ncbi:MAG: hypothetical protein ACRD5M_07970 [Candidatus Acidiferrales bacterium]
MTLARTKPSAAGVSVGGTHAFMLLLAAAFILCAALLPFVRAEGSKTLHAPTPALTATPIAPNSDPIYQQLRNITPGGKTVVVKDFVMKRDASTFTFKSGSFAFLTPVEGKTTGAVFTGSGTFALDPPLANEKWSLGRLTKSAETIEPFSTAVFRFTDGTEKEIEAKGAPPTGLVAAPVGEALAVIQRTLRHDLRFNLDARILQDLLSREPGGFFCAFIKGEKFSGKEIYILDPHGVPADFLQVDVAPEEEAFSTYDNSTNAGVWASFHYSDEYARGTASSRQANNTFGIAHQKLDVTIEMDGALTGTATTTITALTDGVRVVPLRLYHTLRVSSVTTEDEEPLSFIQEHEDADYQFSVILPAPLTVGNRFTFTTRYAGRDALVNQSWAAFALIARTSWYPNSFSSANYSTYDVTLHVPQGLTLVATGTKTAQRTEGNFDVAQWHTDVPFAEASFDLGELKRVDSALQDQHMTLETYANVAALKLLSSMSNKMKRILGEEELAIPLYTDFFGPTPYNRLALAEQFSIPYNPRLFRERSPYPDKQIIYTERPLFSSRRFGATDEPPFFGRSFATLILLPPTSFSDHGQRFVRDIHDSYFFALDPYEIAKQWWGNTVGQISYRDQWMVGGFAEFSASLFLQAFFNVGTYDGFWDEELYLLTEKDVQGRRRIDEGPVTLGSRLGVFRGAFRTPTRQIGPKGAYILNMIRMMLWDNERHDADFKKLMHDFVQTYTNRPATTEDFKAVVEQHMIPAMDLAGDGKMDWFFDEYVYGNSFPNEKFRYSFSTAPDGAAVLNFKIEQSGVEPLFRMIIPVYIKRPDGNALRVASVPLTGNTRFESQITLTGPKPKRAMINYFHDVLCTQN